jgi:hypothetical protein
MEFTLSHPYPLEALIEWRPAIKAEGSDEYRRVLADPAFRRAIKAEAAGKGGVPNRFSYHTLEHMTIKDAQRPEHASLVGKNVAALARAAGKDPLDWLLDFALDGELDAMFDCKLFNTDEDQVRELLRHPSAQIALSDAGAHLSFLCDGLRAASARALGARAPRSWARAGGAGGDQPSRVALPDSRPGPARARRVGRPCVRSGTVGRGPNGASSTSRPARAASTRPRSACTACGSTACAW